MKKNEMRSGSALIVVLGMTAVLMMMAVAFSVLMRTERSGMTNLKHALTARQTSHTAIARVMAAIDESFEHPTNNWPIAGWDPPYISSFESTTQLWQNASIKRVEDRKGNARLLTDELSRHLSPSQLALARNAKVDWVTVRAGVGASKATTQGGPINDMIIARYAFLALNTTGLLDMNIGPMTNGTDAAKQEAIDGTDFISFLTKKGSPKFIDRRNEFGGFSSYAEMWRAFMGDQRYDYDTDLSGTTVTPDLFNTFSMSLDEVDPDGEMKLFIPQGKAGKTFKDDTEKKTYAKLALKRFEKIFANEKVGAGNETVKLASKPLPELTRAQLATQALIDYIDEDDIPNGGIWKDGENPLNYPCTENVPMISHVYSQVEIMNSAEIKTTSPQHPDVVTDDPKTWYTEHTAKLAVSCYAIYLSSDPQPAGYSVDGTFKFKLGNFVDFAIKNWLGRVGRRVVLIGNQSLEEFCNGKSPEDYVEINSPEPPPSPLSVVKSFEFTVQTTPKTYTYDPDTGEIDGVREYYAFSDQEEGDEGFAGLEVLVEAEVVSPSDGVVQKVPAPALKGENYQIRVLPGIRPMRAPYVSHYRMGWAFCLDPRFAYNTSCIASYPPTDNYSPWLTDVMCFDPQKENVPQSDDVNKILNIASVYDPPNDLLATVAKALVDLEGKDDVSTQPGELTPLLKGIVFKDFGDGAQTPDRSVVADQFEGFSSRQKIYPDLFHSESSSGPMFINRGGDTLKKALQMIVRNKPMTSIAEFGNLVIGPWETLSLFATFAPQTDKKKVDFHRVSDYFSLNEARFPKISNIPNTGLDSIAEEYLPAVHSGKLNLNPQLKVKWDGIMGAGKAIYEFNEDPLAVILASASIDDGGTFPLSFSEAKTAASRFYSEGVISGQNNTDPIEMFRFTSDIGNVNVASNKNHVLSALMEVNDVKTDADRERFLGNVLDRLTTRGQSYLVIVRADAYSPKYGSISALGGTTLATEYALVELWRDSEPNRYPNGEYYPDKTASVLPVHGWFIRSCRFFSP